MDFDELLEFTRKMVRDGVRHHNNLHGSAFMDIGNEWKKACDSIPQVAELNNLDEETAAQAVALRLLYLASAMYGRCWKYDNAQVSELFEHLCNEVSIKFAEKEHPGLADHLKATIRK